MTWLTKLLLGFAVICAGVAAVCATSARGATVSSRLEGNSSVFFFEAAPGERNRVTASPLGLSEYRFEDRGADIEAGAGCAQTPDSHVVTCLQLAPLGVIQAQLRDRDDSFSDSVRPLGVGFGLARAVVFGGPGDDTLRGGPLDFQTTEPEVFPNDLLYGGSGNDTLWGEGGNDMLNGDAGDDDIHGGPGNDWILGGPARDRLSGDAGNDNLFGDEFGPSDVVPPAPDVIRSGDGFDITIYFARRSPPRLSVTFDRRGNDGPAGEGDSIAPGLERAYSLNGGWTISPNPGPNGERVQAIGHAELRIYRLSGQGTPGAQSGFFQGSPFRVAEARSATGPTSLVLPEAGFEHCPTRSGAASAAAHRPIHRLRSRTTSGGFRTRGRHSSATVRGTDWTVTDRCDGTLTSVKRGTVKVRDFRLHKTVVLHAGEKYLAKAR